MSISDRQEQDPEVGSEVTFNLWSGPWINVVGIEGDTRRLSLRDCLVTAHQLIGFEDPSPLVIASLQRLMAAVAQDIVAPTSVADLTRLLENGRFDADEVDRFGAQYDPRFELFSETTPFLQTADVGLSPSRDDRKKTVGYLFPEEPTATNINHFFHRYDDELQYSPATAALGLVTVPAFATSGGAGIRPSINGVPPLYVLPQGDTLYETLILSLATPGYQPAIASDVDDPAWRRDPCVERGAEVLAVGYLESLTFPARRVRLFPEQPGGFDSRTGEWSDVLVRTMVFDMGISRPKDGEAWFDPFAAYRISENGPTPIRPQQGKTTWREFGNLFHTTGASDDGAQSRPVRAPSIVLQLAQLQDAGVETSHPWRFRCVGLRTDMKAKVFEWVDDTLDVPPAILADPLAQLNVEVAINRVEEWSRRLAGIHRTVYSDARTKHDAERSRMLSEFWIRLAASFRILTLEVCDGSGGTEALDLWTTHVFDVGYQVLEMAAGAAGDRSDALRQRADALTRYRIGRASKAKEWVK